MNRDPWADLVIAMLSVNNYPMEKTFGLANQLREKRLFDPSFLLSCDLSELTRRLGSAGYDRGETMTVIFTDRLSSLGRLTNIVPAGECTRILSSGSRDEVVSLLSSVKGIGPKVLANFFLLRGDNGNQAEDA